MSRQLRVPGVWLVCVGLAWTLIAGLRSWAYAPNWFDPSDGPCWPDVGGACAAGLRGLWWWVGAGALLTVLGVVLVICSLSSAGSNAPARQLPAVVHALLAAVVSPLLFVPGLLPAFFLLLGGTRHVLVPMALGLWLLELALLAALDEAVGEGGPSPRSRHLAAALVAGAAVGLSVVDQVRDLGHLGAPELTRHAAVIGLGVLLVRFLTAPGTSRTRVAAAAVGAAAALAAVALVLVPVLRAQDGHRSTPQQQAQQQEQEQEPVPSPTPEATVPPAVDPLPVPEPVPTPTPEPVVADGPCAQQDLAFSVDGFDGAMGLRAAALVATNTGAAPCWLEGVPVVVLLQGGRPLGLQVGEGQTPEGGVPQVQRVGVPPGGTAFALLTWRTYGGWADAESPQAVTVALDATTTLVSAALPAGEGPAPFDLADGGAWGIAPWASSDS